MFSPTPSALLRWSTLYFVLGVGLGIYMSATQDFAIMPVHAHVNLLGWVSLSLAAFVYKSYPKAAASTLAKVHFWLQIVMLPVLLGGLYAFLRGNAQIEPLLAMGSTIVGVGIVALALNVQLNVRD